MAYFIQPQTKCYEIKDSERPLIASVMLVF